ncbi:uncharacterized protein LOC131622334 [Vicia villosa]|uniref:uncharacterized protein LOC131622334 n=1 Tax=Vicia villosa TaxID=3911 RepID=UPI00273B6BC0|nr:uncharacterized protein LOC131622334 [Vicia villosa]
MFSLLSRKPPPKSLGFDGGHLPPSWWFSPSTFMVVIFLMKGSISFIQPHSLASTKTKSLIGDPLPPPRTTTKSPFSLPMRSPPEPPPLRNEKLINVILRISNSTMVGVPLFTGSALTHLMLTTFHPPPKSTWIFYRFGGFVGSRFRSER